MGGKLRPAVMAVSAVALLAIASPVAVLTGPLAAQQVAAAPADAKHASKGGNHDVGNAPAAIAPAGTPSARSDAATPPGPPSAAVPATQAAPAAVDTPVAKGSGNHSLPTQIERSKPRAGQPSERADHASAGSRGLHLGAGGDSDESAGNDSDDGAGIAPTSTVTSPAPSSGTPSAGTEAASTPAVATTSTSHAGGTSTPPPVIVVPPTAPQTNPPIAAQPVLTGARLEWILVGVVVALAAAVVAAVRVATLRGRRPPH